MATASAMPRAALPDEGLRPVNLWYVGQRGGWALASAALVAHVQRLVDHHGFPAPMPAPVRASRAAGDDLTIAVRGVALHVVPRSTWPRIAVDRWFDRWLPPEDAEAMDDGQRRAAAADMDSAAFSLRMIAGGRS